jgi:hypothetical protein
MEVYGGDMNVVRSSMVDARVFGETDCFQKKPCKATAIMSTTRFPDLLRAMPWKMQLKMPPFAHDRAGYHLPYAEIAMDVDNPTSSR